MYRDNQCKNDLFGSRVPDFCIIEHPTHVVYGYLKPSIIHSNEYRANHLQRCSEVKVQLLPDLEFGKQGRGCDKVLQVLKCLPSFLYPIKAMPFHSILKNGKHYSVDFEMNWLRAATSLVSYCTTFLEVRCRMSRIAQIFSRIALIPRRVTMNLRNFPAITLKAHLLRFNFIWCR